MDALDLFMREMNNALLKTIGAEQLTIVSGAILKVMKNFDITVKNEALAVPDNTNINLSKIFSGYMVSEGKGASTIKAYLFTLKQFDEFLQGKRFTDVVVYDVTLFMLQMKERGCKESTIENVRANLSAFYSWLLRMEYISKNPFAKIKPVKVPKTERMPFSASEIEALKAACYKPKKCRAEKDGVAFEYEDTVFDIRARALLEVLLTSGIRVSELCNLDRSDIDEHTCAVRVREGKGKKDRTTYMTRVAMEYVKQMLEERRDNNPWLFASQTTGKRMSPDGIRLALNTLAARAGVEDVHPHRFRRTFCTNFANSSMPVTTLRKLMGHADLNTTQRYVYTSDEQLADSYKKFA